MKEFWLCFVPLFVAVDAVGILPTWRGEDRRGDRRHRRHDDAQGDRDLHRDVNCRLTAGRIS
jgi:hypothetical protein